MPVAITQAGPDRLKPVASVLGRAFVTEPMVRWSLGVHGDVAQRFVRMFEYFLEGLMELGLVWEAGEALGAAVWVSPDQMDAWEEAQRFDPRFRALTEDGGTRNDGFWEWVESRLSDEPLWHLDSIGVEPDARGLGIGSALVEHGLQRARADGRSAILETGTPGNVPFYERLGFRVLEAVDAPGGGPTIWFMRWDP